VKYHTAELGGIVLVGALPSPYTLLGGAAGAVLTMVAGSYFGDKGTLLGAATGSVITATASTVVEHNGKKVREKLKGPGIPGIPLHAESELYVRDLAKIAAAGERNRRFRKYKLAGLFTMIMAISFTAAFGLMGLVGVASGGTVKGFTVLTKPAPTRTVTPPPTVITTTPTAVPSLSVSPSAVPSGMVSSSSSSSPSPSISGAPAGTPSPTADTIPTGTTEGTPTVRQPALKAGQD